jgi:hypothetical protein
VLAMKYSEPQSETYNRMTLDGMRLSVSKIKAVQASMTDGEYLIEYLFPILRFHSRITQLEKDDFTYLFHRKNVTYNGYYMRTDSKPAEVQPEGKPLGDYQFGDTSYEYLDKMRELCEKNGVELILVKAPSLYPYWYEEWDRQICDYAEKYNLKYYNFLENTEEIGLDFSADTYDGGLHLNVYGAEKLAHYFGRILTEECGLESRRGDEDLETIWEEKLKVYKEARDSGIQK